MDFEGLVKRYTSLSDNIKESSKTMRELRKKSNELGDAILEYMKKHDIEEAHVEGGGKLVRRVSRRTGPLSAQVLAAELKQHLLASNILVGGSGDPTVLRLMPPLNVSVEALGALIAAIRTFPAA